MSAPSAVPPPPEIDSSEPTVTVAPVAVTTADDSDPEQLMRELMKKFGSKEKPSEFFVRMAEEFKKEEAASRLTPLEIPTRPQTLIDTPTSKAISTHIENPQIPPETLAQEITPTVPTPDTEAQFPTEPPLEKEKNTQEEEDKIEEEEEEGKAGEDEPSTRAGDEEEATLAEEGDEGDEESEAEGDEEVKSEGKGRGKQADEVSEAEGDEKVESEGNEGSVVKEVEEEDRIVGAEKVAEKVDERVDDEKVDVEEEARDRGAEAEVEAEIVVLDDVTSEDMGTRTDERTTRRQSHRVRNMKDAAPANQQRKLRLNDSEETGDDIPQA